MDFSIFSSLSVFFLFTVVNDALQFTTRKLTRCEVSLLLLNGTLKSSHQCFPGCFYVNRSLEMSGKVSRTNINICTTKQTLKAS